ncbi:hypothetical protein SK128_021373 [Halocaridina rubra]|uniref:Uncharacterized protein n=1 Tax=Halocaridina rubra TaxID=373956 RepID=A0AAN8ZXG0_HALRR
MVWACIEQGSEARWEKAAADGIAWVKGRGRSERRFIDVLKEDLRVCGVAEEDARDKSRSWVQETRFKSSDYKPKLSKHHLAIPRFMYHYKSRIKFWWHRHVGTEGYRQGALPNSLRWAPD